MLGGISADRFGAMTTGILSLATRTVILIAMPLALSSMINMSSTFFFYALVSYLFFVPMQTRLLRLAPEATGIVLSLNNSFVYAGAAVGFCSRGTRTPRVCKSRTCAQLSCSQRFSSRSLGIVSVYLTPLC